MLCNLGFVKLWNNCFNEDAYVKFNLICTSFYSVNPTTSENSLSAM